MTTAMQATDAIKSSARRFARNPAAVYATIFGLYLLARTVIIIGGEVFQSWDSQVYAYREDPAFNRGPLVSFVGHAPRSWGLPLFYALFPDDHWRTIGQWAFGTVVWGFFAWEVSRQLRTRAARYVAVAGLLLFACLTNVASWDLAILTESMSVNVGLLVLALLLRWFRTGSIASIVGMTAAATWWNFIREDIRLFLVAIMVVLVGYVTLPRLRGWWRRRQEREAPAAPTGRVIPALVACLVMGLGLVWYSATEPGMTEAMVPYDDDSIQPPLPQDEYMYVYRLRVDASLNPAIWETFKTDLGMPTCPEIEAFTTQTDWQARKWAEAYVRCPAMVAWVAEHKGGYGAYWIDLASGDPALAAKTFASQTSYNLGGEIYADVPHVVPTPIERLAFPSQRYALPLLLVAFGAALAAAWWAGAQRTDRRLLLFAGLLFATATLSACATIAIHTGEIQRYGVQEAFATRVSIIILLACALDAWLVRRGRVAEESAAGAGGATDELEPSRV